MLHDPHETRRACAGVAPSMHEVDRRTRSHVANFVSRSMQKLCVIHVRPPPDQHQTAPRPCPIIQGQFPAFWNWGTRPPQAYHFVSFVSFVVSTAIFRLSLPGPPPASAGPRNINRADDQATSSSNAAAPQATPKPHQCDIKATPMRVDSQAVATSKPPQCDPKATSVRPSCVLHASLMRPSCVPHASLMRPSCVYKAPTKPSRREGRRAEGRISGFGPIGKAGKRRLALSGGRRTARPAMDDRFPPASCGPAGAFHLNWEPGGIGCALQNASGTRQ